MSEIEEMVRNLPPDIRIQVQNVVEFLIERKKTEPKDNFCVRTGLELLRDVKSEYTSLELQKKALLWRGD